MLFLVLMFMYSVCFLCKLSLLILLYLSWCFIVLDMVFGWILSEFMKYSRVLKVFNHMQIRPDRQTLYWSATWPKEVETLARQFLRNPYKVESCTPLIRKAIVEIGYVC